MPEWLRNFVMVTVITVWTIIIFWSYLRTGQLPDASTWLVPTAIWTALTYAKPARAETLKDPPTHDGS